MSIESDKTKFNKINNGFFVRFMKGESGLDVGGKGYQGNVTPILPTAKIIDLDTPGYDGKTLPFIDESQDYIFSSHTLEHIEDYKAAIKEWFRVTKIDGHIVTVVPHQFLYEKKKSLPSKWNGSHFRFYTPASLLKEFEESLEPNTYRVRFLEDGDKDFDYTIGPDRHSGGQYEITLVIQKIQKPNWELE